jgi:hypothetical protein
MKNASFAALFASVAPLSHARKARPVENSAELAAKLASP